VNGTGPGRAWSADGAGDPTLEQVLRAPALVAEMGLGDVRALLIRIAAAHTQLAAAELAIAARLDVDVPVKASSDLLDVKQAAARLGMSVAWLYDHADELPFTRRVGRRARRFDADGIDRWLASRRRG
jgi:predicted DNA-binding transcriptional regulator AlpA